MKRRPLMRIGQEFTAHDGCLYRVTDVGTRTFLAINVTQALADHNDDESWHEGPPPYAVVEHVFDETDFALVEGVEGIEWAEDLTMKTLTASLGGYDERGEAMWPDWMKTNLVVLTVEGGERRSVTLPQLLADLAAQDIACLPATVMQRLIRDWKP